ncbi:unnamed protein product [Discosporangium mesarthrocarpum]
MQASTRAIGGPTAIALGSGLLAGGLYLGAQDKDAWKKRMVGIQRSSLFWSLTMPIYLHYRATQWWVDGLSDEEQEAAYNPLHDQYAKSALDIILRLKGFYVKIGQMAATRADFLPHQYYDQVKTLQSEAPAEPFDYIRALVEKSLKQPLESVFSSFDEEPLGAASIGQVHHATLKDGTQAVVKVMFPNVEEMFRSDMKTMKDFCTLAQPEHLSMLTEVERQFLTEFDFTEEAKNLALVRANMRIAWNKEVIVPEPFIATPEVLVMELVPGEKLVDALQAHFKAVAHHKGMTVDQLREEIAVREARGELTEGPSATEMSWYRSLIVTRAVVMNCVAVLYNALWSPLTGQKRIERVETKLPFNTAHMIELLFRVHGHQIFVDGAFNGDPHPGNILLTPDGKLGLIDYGQVKHMTLPDRVKLARLVVALAEDDKEAVVGAYTDMGFKTKRMDPDVAYRHAKCIFDTDHKDDLGGMNVQLYREELQKIDPIEIMPDEYVMAARVAALLRGLGYALKYKPSAAKMWEPQARALLKSQQQQ